MTHDERMPKSAARSRQRGRPVPGEHSATRLFVIRHFVPAECSIPRWHLHGRHGVVLLTANPALRQRCVELCDGTVADRRVEKPEVAQVLQRGEAHHAFIRHLRIAQHERGQARHVPECLQRHVGDLSTVEIERFEFLEFRKIRHRGVGRGRVGEDQALETGEAR